ncbi:uncharacterized membrane protein HdeD (DUF308 family) [Arthrobacter sp. PvP023]|uniref:hypothetical protein n=1 Tax=Micrococcaceae TaxID=1268 RepID=UPI001AE4B426|nr:hypothetical protein [Arthrobacter sp. PvP023]MBP1134121.1 uncharacterized membrane protein HdeD (DUF308 family) [Arthrobacter sp. PvP023]
MTLPATPSDPAALTAPAADLWKPVLTRALLALAFGALTVFWASPSASEMGWAGGLYLLATGVILIRGIGKFGLAAKQSAGKIMAAAGAALTGAGVAVAFLGSELVFGVLAALGLGLLGAAELCLGFLYRGRSVLARDWLASGVIGLGTAAALPFFISLGAHALLGVAGGGAIISGVLWILAALTLRHDARSVSSEAVN